MQLTLCMLTVAAVLLSGCGDPPRVVATAKNASGSSEQPEPATAQVRVHEPSVLVDVAGHVRRPGVYRLATGARVHEAIAAAGGAKPGAALDTINRAAPLVDGQQVLVPDRSGLPPPATPTSGAGPGTTISLNGADAAALDQLPGIGPVTAERIVQDRATNGPFASVDDLDRVPGIGPASVEALRAHVTT